MTNFRVNLGAAMGMIACTLSAPVLASDDDYFQSAPALADGDYIQFGIGADYSSGDYGASEDTNVWALPVSVKYQASNFYVRASIAYLDVEGPEGVIPGDGGVSPGDGGAGTTSRQGIGDLNLTAGYSFGLSDTTYFDIIGRAKLPTASESKSLGTGTTDFTAEAELLQVFGPVSASLRGGRRFNGSNTLYPLEDVWQAGAGLYVQSNDVTVGLDYDWREGSLPTAPDRSEATASLTYRLNPALRLQGYGYTGFADGSPDLGGGLQILYRFGQ